MNANKFSERLDRLHADLITRFGNIVGLAKVQSTMFHNEENVANSLHRSKIRSVTLRQ